MKVTHAAAKVERPSAKNGPAVPGEPAHPTAAAERPMGSAYQELAEPIQAIVTLSGFLLEEAQGQDGPKGLLSDMAKIHEAATKLVSLVKTAWGNSNPRMVSDAGEDNLKHVRHDLRNGLNQVLGFCQLLMYNDQIEGFGAFLADLRKIYQLCQDFEQKLLNFQIPGQAASLPAIVLATQRQPLRAKPGNLLIVDDSPSGREVLRRLLESQGHRISEADNGAQALKMMKETSFDLVLLDVLMPGVDGFQVLQHLKSRPKIPRGAIIVISGMEDAQSSIRCIDLGADDYLTKPIDHRLLQSRVSFYLQKRQSRPLPETRAAEPATVLIVDDEEGNRILLEGWVSKLGHRPVLFADGQKALEHVRHSPPDLMLLDLMMPNLNGLEVLRHLKADPRLGLIPVIVISAVDDQNQVLPCIRMGAEDYLIKPFNADLLQARIQGSLERLEKIRREQRRHKLLKPLLEDKRKSGKPSSSDTQILSALKPKVFVSHSSADRAFVEREIIRFLEHHKIDTWYARDDIHTAAKWEKSIREGLKICDWFLVVLSPASVASEWVQTEVHWAMQRRPGNIVPVLIEECDPAELHLMLEQIQFVDFRQRDVARKKLLEVWKVKA